MYSQIQKRDGRKVRFDQNKITKAILQAAKATGEFEQADAVNLTKQVLKNLQKENGKIPSVEHVQDVVEETLLNSPHKKTAKAYIIYRDQHTKMRQIVSKAAVDTMDQYLQKLDWQVKENW